MNPARPSLNGIAVELTAQCNQRCRYCYNAWRGEPEPPTDGARVLQRVRVLLDTFELQHVTLTGGEPLASPVLFDLLELLASRAVPVQLISNAALATEELARRLAPFRVRYVQATLNGPSAELHELHSSAGQFEKALAGIEALSRHGVRVAGCVVVTRRNAASLGQILALWQKLGVRQVALSRFSPAGYASRFSSELLPTVPDVESALRSALPFAGALKLYSTMPLPPCTLDTRQFKGIRFGSCAIGTPAQELALGTDGRLRHCTLHRGALHEADLLDGGVDAAAVLARSAAYRQKVPDFCIGCAHASRCLGGCGAASEWLHGDGRKTPDPFLWQHVGSEQ